MKLSPHITKILVPSAALALVLACSASGVQVTPDPDDSGTTSSTSSSSGGNDSGTKDSGTTSSSGSSGDASTEKDSSGIKDSSTTKDTSVAPVCPKVPTVADYDARSKPPIAGKNCTATEINTFADDLSDPNNTTWADVRTLVKSNVSAACASCLFTDEASSTWGAIVVQTADPTLIIPNWGACLQRFAGAPAACATAYQQFWQCGSIACDECTPQATQDQCFTDHYDPGGLCDGTPKTSMNTACGANLTTYESMCDGQAQDNIELLFNHAAALCQQ